MPRKTKIDEIDRIIIKALLGYGRIRKADLAARLGMSASAIAARIARLENDDVLQGYTAIVNGKSLGLPEHMVRVEIHPERPAHRMDFEESLRALDVVASAKRLVGLGDYLLRGVGPNCVDAVWEQAERCGLRIKTLTSDAIDVEIKPLRASEKLCLNSPALSLLLTFLT